MLFEFGGLFRKFWRGALILGTLVIGTNTLFVAPVYAATGINQQLNFQGRLLNNQGAVAPDGNYNVEFKIYQDGTGAAAGDPGGTLKWTEDWLNSASHTVQVVNGYISVQLGSVNPFGNSIDWNQDTIWLSVNIGNTSNCTITTNFTANCGGDGEMVPMKRLSAVPYSLNSARLGGLTSADFIQNTTTVQAGANLAIGGSARADTSILTPTIDTNTAVALNIGTTNATVINLNENVTVATGKTLTLAGDTRANITANITAPAEGAMVYDTTNHQMLTWNGTKWVNSGSDAYLVAASNSSQADKDAADYVATGTGDQATIQSALDRADPASAVSGARKSGKVYLFAGTYITSDVISIKNNTTLAGSGRASIIKFADIHGQTKNMITNSDTTTGTGITVRDLQLDGNYLGVNTTGAMDGIHFDGVGGGSGASARQGANIINNWVNNFLTNNVYLVSSPNSTIIGNNVQGAKGNGIYISSANRSNITNNVSQGNGGSGIVLGGAISENVVANTFAKNGTAGIYLNGNSNNNSIVGNNLYSNGGNDNNAIYFPGSSGASYNTITNNTINDDADSNSNIAINLVDNSAQKNYLADNVFTSTLGTSTINDPAGSNTVYANQPRGEAGAQLTNRTANDTQAFAIQKADGTNVLAVDTTNNKVLVAGTLDTTTATQLNIGTATANAISIGNGTITTTIVGYTGVTLNATTGTTMVCRNATGLLSTCDATYLTPTATNFIQNSTSLQATSNFHISGTGQADTALISPSIRAVTDGTAAIKLQNAAGTTTALTVDTTNNRVGIGTATTPASTLHVGVNNASATATTALLEQQGLGNTTLQLKNTSEVWNMGIDSSDGNAFKITTANTASTTSPFGNSTTGDADDSADNNDINAGKYTANATGSVVSLSVYVACAISPASNNQFRMAIYSDNGSGTSPTTLLGQSAVGTLVNGWNQVSIPATAVTNGTVYWIAYNTNGTGLNNNCYRVTSGAGANSTVWVDPYTFGSMPSSWPGSTGTGTARPSFYATIQTSSGTNTYTSSLLQMSNTGRFTLHNSLDSTGAFQVQNAAGTAVINVDTTNSKVLIAGTLDTTTAATLTIGGTNASAISLAQNVTVATGKTLRLAGDTRANITAIAAPTEGMMTYDTTNKQLLVYANGKWQADRTTSTKIVAASNSSQIEKDGADYVATGTGDQAQINSALTAAAGGRVYLMEGTYTINAAISIPNNTTLGGAGYGTVITVANAFNTNINAITNTTTGGNGAGIVVQDLRLEGNNTNQTAGTMTAIYFNGVGSGSGSAAVQGGKIANTWTNNWRSNGISLSASSNSTITGVTVQGNTSDGISITTGSINNSLIGSTIQGNGASGVYVASTTTTNNTFTGNTVQANSNAGFYLNTTSANSITSNAIQGNNYGVYLYVTANNNLVTGNVIANSGGATANNAIYLNAADSNTITSNSITDSSATTTNYALNISNSTSDTNYFANNTLGGGSINDVGTGTIFGGQADGSGNLLMKPAGTVELQKNTNVTGILSASTSVLTPIVDRSTAGTLQIGTNATNTTALTIGNTAAGTLIASNTITVGSATNTPANTNTIIGAAQTNANKDGNAMVIQGSTGLNGNGGTVTLQGGNANGTGTLGGNLTLAGGTGSTSNGAVILATSTFQTLTNDANCFATGEVAASCTISAAAINNNASVLVGFTADGQIATMPDPSIITAGRVVYVTASGATKDFTLRANTGAGVGIEQNIAMRKNTTATMIWNGADWTAAGASSSTTMQAAYDNTLQSAGGAELVVSKTAATNGLTIRDSTTNSVNGALLTVQSSSAANLFSVNSNVTEYTSNSGAETYGVNTTTFPASTWVLLNTAAVTRNTATANIATGQGSAQVITSTSASSGVKNVLTTSLTASQHYNVSFTAKLPAGAGAFTDLMVYYSIDGTTTVGSMTQCTSANQAIKTSVWTKINCAFTAPSTGITSANSINIFQVGSGTSHTFYVDNISVTIAADFNYVGDGGADTSGGTFSAIWDKATFGGAPAGAVAQYTNDGQAASDSAKYTTVPNTAKIGIRNKLAVNPLPSTLYRVTVYAKSSTAMSDFMVRYTPTTATANTSTDANYVDCTDYNTQAITTTTWTKVTCYIKTTLATPDTSYLYFVQQTAPGATRDILVDTASMTLSAATTPNVQVGGGVNGGPTTLFTLDKGASAPIAGDNDALLGSMYYDTTLGKLQCYEADGWGACGSSPDNIVTISPEYTNAVLHGAGIGTLTSDICSDNLNINDGSPVNLVNQPTICGTNESYNFYKWTSPQPTSQKYSIYVTYQLPATFKSFNSGQTSLMGRTDNGSNGGTGTVQYTIFKNTGSLSTGLTPCDPTVDATNGSPITVSTGTSSSWSTVTAIGKSDPSTCGFAAGNSIVFKIDVFANKNANAYVGNLNFAFGNK